MKHDGTPKITDFGLAKQLPFADGYAPAGLTQTGALLGTPSYMSPEQALGKKDIGPATDIYGLGAILYELLTNRPPFTGESSLATLQAVCQDDVVPPLPVMEPRLVINRVLLTTMFCDSVSPLVPWLSTTSSMLPAKSDV